MNLNFEKYPDRLIPAIVEDADSGQTLMLGYVSKQSLEASIKTGFVTFYSRSRQRLWTKGETSGNKLRLVSLREDCDSDALLIRAVPTGPVCHTGARSCFGEDTVSPFSFLSRLEQVIDQRISSQKQDSYIYRLTKDGSARPAKKVGEEAVETVIAALGESRERLCEEAADLLFHLLVVLRTRNISFRDVVNTLSARHQASENQGEN
jgi:phosphoribosyl-ATP pyrophosphohydrolase/phosphoribosyl-AMP cyclohydrolase